MQKPLDSIIFTDGACSGNPGPGGWGSIIATPDGKIVEIGGSALQTTNNRMELMATIEAFRVLEKKTDVGQKILVHSDSSYVLRGISGWVFGWLRNGWKTSQGKDVENADLWEQLLTVTKNYKGKIEWRYVRGHQGNPGNERCDEIAVSFSQGSGYSLYVGSAENYSIDLYKVPVEMSLPPMKDYGAEKKAKAGTYLSYVNGKLNRDSDWKSCEARVKGVAGAKFKKVTSVDEEREILKKWGL